MLYKLLLIFTIWFNYSYCQNDYKPYKVFFATSIVTAASIPMYAMVSDDDKVGKVTYGSMAALSVSSALIGTGLYLKVKENRKPFLHYSLMAIAGSLDGFNEEITHHYDKVKVKMPYLNDQWFNPSISWANKYKNHDVNQGPAFFGSKTIFVASTDAYHASRALNKVFVIGGIFTFDNNKSVKKRIKNIIFTSLVYTTSKGLTHYILSN